MELKRRLFGREGGRGIFPPLPSGRIPCGKSAAAESCYQGYWLILNVMMMIMQMRMLQALLVGNNNNNNDNNNNNNEDKDWWPTPACVYIWWKAKEKEWNITVEHKNNFACECMTEQLRVVYVYLFPFSYEIYHRCTCIFVYFVA